MKKVFNGARRLAACWFAAAFLIPQTAFSEDPASVCEQPDQEAKPLFRTPPAYPANAGFFCIEGTVVVKGEVGPNGRVMNAYVAESDPPFIFDEAASVTETWIYRPKCEGGVPVSSEFTTALDFVMADIDHAPCLNVLEGEGLEMYTHVMSMFSEQRIWASQRENWYEPVPPLPEKPSYSGDWGKIEGFLLRAFNRSTSVTNFLAAGTKETGWDRIFDPARLAADTGMTEGRRMIGEMRLRYGEASDMARRYNQENITDLERLDIGDETRLMFFGAGDWADDEGEPEEYISQTHWKILSETEAILDLLAETTSDWFVTETGHIAFITPESGARYRVHLEALRGLHERVNQVDFELMDRFWGKVESRR